MNYIVIDGKKYAEDRPKECRYCYFWENKKTGCTLGEENCYYLMTEPEDPVSACTNCPYSKVHPCVGWCTKKILEEKGDKKRDALSGHKGV